MTEDITYGGLNEKLFINLKKYIEDNYIEEESPIYYQIKSLEELPMYESTYMEKEKIKRSLVDVVENLDESFSH